jgi:hypothetical protein
MANHEIQSGNNSEDDKKLLMKLTAEQVRETRETDILLPSCNYTQKNFAWSE